MLSVLLTLLAAFPSQLVPASQETKMRGMLPPVNDSDIQEAIDGDLLFWTEREIHPAHEQDGRIGSRKGVQSSLYNSSFADSTGSHYEFPWKHSGGIDDGVKCFTFKALSLPLDEYGNKWPIVYWMSWRHGVRNGRCSWVFPAGTYVFEILAMRHQGVDYTFELRSRLKVGAEWQSDVFRPVEDYDHYKILLKDYYGDKSVRYLDDTLVPISIADTQHPRRSFASRAYSQNLPAIDSELVKQMLNMEFKSVMFDYWDRGPDAYCNAPTTTADFHIVPRGYHATTLCKVNDHYTSEGCMQCHRDTQKKVAAIDPGRDWYGRVRGSDGIFSFHAYDPSVIGLRGQSRGYRFNRRLTEAGYWQPINHRLHYRPRYVDTTRHR